MWKSCCPRKDVGGVEELPVDDVAAMKCLWKRLTRCKVMWRMSMWKMCWFMSSR